MPTLECTKMCLVAELRLDPLGELIIQPLWAPHCPYLA